MPPRLCSTLARPRVLAASLLAAGVVAGCTNDGPSYDGPTEDILDGLCAYLDRCPDAIGYPIAYRDRQECVDILGFAATCRLTVTETNGVTVLGVAERMLEVDPDQASRCLEWLDAASCEDWARLGEEDTPCDLAFTFGGGDDVDDGGDYGPGAEGEPCDGTYDCQRGLYCGARPPDAAAGVVFCEVCTPRRAEGESCASDRHEDECVEGTECRWDYTAPEPELRCLAPSPDGAPCNQPNDCASEFCRPDPTGGQSACDPGGHVGDACAESYECRTSFCDAGACAERRPNGAACDDGSACLNWRCVDGTCGAPDGETCSSGSECASLGCDGGVCGPRLPGSECYDDAECPAGTICNDELNQCGAPGEAGAPCRRDLECVSGFCDSFQDRCAAPPTVGAECTRGSCGPRLYCTATGCAPRPGPGERCEAIDSCAQPFICLEGTCELINLTCAPAPAGEQCAFLQVCEEDAYCDLFDGVTCRPRHQLGEACTTIRSFSDSCAAGLRCVEGACANAVPRGEACASDGECELGVPCVNDVCGGASSGARECTFEDDCPEDTYCSRETDTCLPRGGVGTDCSRDEGACDGTTFCERGACAARGARGAECDDDLECAAGLYCFDYTSCEPRLAVGADCSSGGPPCVEGADCCYDSAAGQDRCEALGGPGAECDSGRDCVSGLCDRAGDVPFCRASRVCALPGA